MEFKLEGFLQNRKRTSSHNAAIVTDHLGNRFESVQKMIMAYKITPGKYYYYKTIYRLLEPAQLLKLILDKQKEKDNGKKTPTHT